MKIIFMGTPDFAVPALEALAQSPHEVSLVVTQPDRQKGRGKQLEKSDVKLCAEKYGIPVFQPAKVKSPEGVQRLRQENADLIVVAAYGQILSEEILDLPKYGCVNIHGSLLPRWRGAAPIQWAVIEGDEKTGLTIMQMDKGLDTGDILLQEETPIGEKETAAELYERLAKMGGPLLLRALSMIEDGTITRTKQDDAKSCYAKMLKKDYGDIDWSMSAVRIERLVRGLNSWPGTYTHLNGKVLKIWGADVAGAEDVPAGGIPAGGIPAGGSGAVPGAILGCTKDAILVQTGDGVLALKEVQPAGKKRMPVQSFLLGYHVAGVFEKAQEAEAGR